MPVSQSCCSMRWPCITLALVPFVASCWFNQSPAATPITGEREQASLVFDEYLVNFGPRPITARAMIEIPFRYRNVSDKPVEIKSLTPSCGCMQPRMDSMLIPPRGTGNLLMPVRLANEKPGPHEYLVKVIYEDSDIREVDIAMKVVLPEKEILVEPRAMWFFQSGTKTTTQTVSITDYRGESFEIKDIRCSSDLWTIEKEADVTDIAGNRVIKLAVTLKENAPQGTQRGLAVVYTSDKRYPAIQIPLGCQSLKSGQQEAMAFVADPETIVLKPTPDGELTAAAIVRTKGGAKADFDTIEVTPNFVTASFETVEGKHTVVKVSAKLDEAQKADTQRAIITIKPKQAGADPLTIPVVIPRQKTDR